MSKPVPATARIDNGFLFAARYRLNTRDQKIILALISRLDPSHQDNFFRQELAVTEIADMLRFTGTKWGDLYTELLAFTERVLSNHITFPTEVQVGGKPFPRKINWFEMIEPVHQKDGTVALRFCFAPALKPFLLDLTQYTQLSLAEMGHLSSPHALRTYQLCQAELSRRRKHQKIVHLELTVDQYKALLDVNYPRFNSLNQKVIQPSIDQINKHTSLEVEVDFEREGRSIERIRFRIQEKSEKVRLPAHTDTLELSRSQQRAWQILARKGVHEEYIPYLLRQIAAAGELTVGFEDYAVYLTWTWMKERSIDPTPAIYVSWFKQGPLEPANGVAWAEVREWLVNEQKRCSFEKPDEYAQRMEQRKL